MKIIIAKGNAWVPARFYDYAEIEESDLSEYEKKGWILCTWPIKIRESKHIK